MFTSVRGFALPLVGLVALAVPLGWLIEGPLDTHLHHAPPSHPFLAGVLLSGFAAVLILLVTTLVVLLAIRAIRRRTEVYE